MRVLLGVAFLMGKALERPSSLSCVVRSRSRHCQEVKSLLKILMGSQLPQTEVPAFTEDVFPGGRGLQGGLQVSPPLPPRMPG